jgi:hypothetical protein
MLQSTIDHILKSFTVTQLQGLAFLCEMHKAKYQAIYDDLKSILPFGDPVAVEALKTCHKSLCTYGVHPIIDQMVNKVIEKSQ